MTSLPLRLDLEGLPVDAVASDPAGELLAAASGRELVLVPTAAGAPTRTLALPGKEPRATALALSPKGDRAAVAFRSGGVATVDLATGDARHLRQSEARHRSVAWSPDGRFLAAGQIEPWVTVFDVEKGKRICVLDPDVFDDEGRTAIVFAGEDLLSTALNRVFVWPFARIAAGRVKLREVGTIGMVPAVKPRRLGRDGFRHVIDLALSPDRTRVAALETVEGECAVSRLDLATGKSVGRALALPRRASRIAWALEPAVIAVDHPEEGLALWDLDARRPLELELEGARAAEVTFLAADARSGLLAAATSAGLRRWHLPPLAPSPAR